MNKFVIWLVVLTALALAGAAWAGEGKTEPQVRVEIDLVDGSQVIGLPGIEAVSVETAYAKMSVPLKQITAIKIEADHETAALEMRNGDNLKGVLTLEPLKLETVFGTSTIGIECIRAMHVALLGGGLSDAARPALVLYYAFDRDEGDKVTDLSGKQHPGGRPGRYRYTGKRSWLPK